MTSKPGGVASLVAERDALAEGLGRCTTLSETARRYVADALFASGVVKDEREVQAAALEAAADTWEQSPLDGGPAYDADVPAWLRAQAAEVRR